MDSYRIWGAECSPGMSSPAPAAVCFLVSPVAHPGDGEHARSSVISLLRSSVLCLLAKIRCGFLFSGAVAGQGAPSFGFQYEFLAMCHRQLTGPGT